MAATYRSLCSCVGKCEIRLSGSHNLPRGVCRMLWSFSRDGGIPFHQLWSAINESTQTPILAVWAMVTFAFLLGLPMLHSTSAFQAVTSICSIGLYISCEPLPLTQLAKPSSPLTNFSSERPRLIFQHLFHHGVTPTH